MWPFTSKSKPKPTGFTDTDGVYKVHLDRDKFIRNSELNVPFLEFFDQRARKNGHPELATHIEHQKKLIEYAKRGEPVPASWLDPSIGTFRADSDGLPAKYPASENRG